MAAAGAPPGNGQLQQMLQAAVQDVQWTYSLFWQFCPQQGVLVWSDGYYNGAIKTRKTVQPMEVSAEEASLQRSQQLRELYDSLSVGDARRPSAALSPEDLTETEWFYLMCVSFSFPPAVGLPGKAYIKRQHVWLTGAHEVDSKVFSRAILAKSARVQTVVCIPLMDGVVELGSTERLQEDPSLVQQVKTFFVDHLHRLPPPKPALSEHSTSNPTASRFHSPPFPMYAAANPAAISNIHQVNEDEDDDDNESDSEAETGRNSRPMSGAGDQNPPNQAHLGRDREPSNSAVAEPSELMQLEMSEDIRLGSPEDASNNMDPGFPVGGDVVTAGGSNIPANAMVGQQRRADSFSRAESSRRWPVIQHDSLLQQQPLPPLFSGAPPLEEEESAAEDTHYSQTVSSILQYQAGRWSSEASPGTTMGGGYLRLATPHSAFSKWPARADHHVHIPEEHSSQWLLKYILFTVPFLHTNNSPKSQEPGPVDPASRLRAKGAPNDELSANHVLAERRRREKLNERFIILRSLVPFVTKMDKASILGDTIEYVKQLRRKIQDLEARAGQIETERVRLVEAAAKSNSSSGLTVAERAHCGGATDKRKVRVVESSTPLQPAHADMLQVSIIESDALIELQCPYREGLLLDVMVLLREMRVEVTAVQSSMNNGFFTAELRAKVKVKENVNGKKASIVEVKRAINQIVPHSDDL